MRATTPTWKPVSAALGASRATIDLRLRPRDERRQTVNADSFRHHWLGLRLRLGLRLILGLLTGIALAMFARLLVALERGLVVARTVAVASIRLLRRLRRLRSEARLLAETREILAFVFVVVADRLLAPRLLLVLPELLLGGGDEAEVVLGVLVVVLGRDRVAGRASIARKLKIFLGDMGGGPADLDIRAVGFVDPGHWVLTAPVVVIVIVIVVPVAHPLLILTVSHVLPFIPALEGCVRYHR